MQNSWHHDSRDGSARHAAAVDRVLEGGRLLHRQQARLLEAGARPVPCSRTCGQVPAPCPSSCPLLLTPAQPSLTPTATRKMLGDWQFIPHETECQAAESELQASARAASGVGAWAVNMLRWCIITDCRLGCASQQGCAAAFLDLGPSSACCLPAAPCPQRQTAGVLAVLRHPTHLCKTSHCQ